MDELRNEIDSCDNRILDILLERHALAQQLGSIKRERGLPIFDPVREQEIIDRLTELNARRIDPHTIGTVWREIFSASRQAQQPTKVAYLGPEGTFTQQAALTRFGASASSIAANTISAAFNMAANRTVDYAVLPVENTMHGIVGETVDLLGAARLPLIVGEIVIPINMVFSSRAEELAGVARIYSKNEAFRQCSVFLDQSGLAGAVRIPVASTAEAARRATDDPEGAALSSEIAANQAGVPIRFRHVENDPRNKTRFFILGQDRLQATGDDKTSVFAKVPNVSGGLEKLLRNFREKGINLSKIESRPMDSSVSFETWFYIDLDGHASEPAVAAILKEHDLVWLGSYPRC